MPVTDASNPLGAEEVAEDPTEEIDWEKQAAENAAALADAESALERQTADAERNTRRLSSSMQSQVNFAKQQAQAEQEGWEDKFHRERMAGMEEAEALRYDNARMAEQVDVAKGQVEELRKAHAQAQAASSYMRHFRSLGVSEDQLNTSGSLQELSDSGYRAVEDLRAQEQRTLAEREDLIGKQEAELNALRGVTDPNAIPTSDLNPPAVATHTPGSVSVPKTEEQALEAAKQWFGGETPTVDMLYRAVESGQLPATVLPGLEGMPKEA